MKVEIEKFVDEQVEWLVCVDGVQVGEITQEREDFASASSRARGTKVAGYSVDIDREKVKGSKWFPVSNYPSARAALAAAKEYAIRLATLEIA